ncbi:hypothetical protein CIL05_07310 [Virgibacillus profundi]|uniref:Uncharacterized protein n=1 Tax=Virgibacillus profundi TaxID=2024555 RepID=A0A2A2IEV2_9BACI|nr:hypothetical protein [Virgibacillus profundi]PAV30269.1 hypothetical protein CIL05_07310 [Virgibacillus profundi]PXY54441.1 hypothetical protein CIT14_07395 [Virgibacillus profundi]
MNNIINQYAYKKAGHLSNLIGKVEISESIMYTYQLKFHSGTVTGFDHVDDIVVVEFGDTGE